jgi:hyperosmotically inducible protein
MRTVYRSIILGIGLSLLAGCNSMPQNMGMGNIFPPSQQNNDVAITDAVTQALMNNQELSIYRFNVVSMNGDVTISGYVRKIRQSDLAESIATKVAGVKTVRNNIIVRR